MHTQEDFEISANHLTVEKISVSIIFFLQIKSMPNHREINHQCYDVKHDHVKVTCNVSI